MNKLARIIGISTLTLTLMTTGIYAATPSTGTTATKFTTNTMITAKDSEMNINTSSELIANKIT